MRPRVSKILDVIYELWKDGFIDIFQDKRWYLGVIVSTDIFIITFTTHLLIYMFKSETQYSIFKTNPRTIL